MVWTVSYGFWRDTQKTLITYIEKVENGKKTYISNKNVTIKTFTDGNCTDATPAQITGNGNITPANKTEDPTLEITGITGTITKAATGTATVPYGHILTDTFDMSKVHWEIISPTLMAIVGMGLVYMGNWGTYHKKACKGSTAPVPDKGTTEKCECKGSPSSTSTSATLRVHNTTIEAATGGLEAIATITATGTSGAYNGDIESITATNLSKSGTLTKETKLQVGEILKLTGGTASTAADAKRIEGTIIVTKDGTLGGSLTLKGHIDGTLNLSNGSTNTIKVTKEGGSLNASTLTLQGITVSTGGGLNGTATMTITSDEHDLTTITDQVNITVSKLTKDKVKILEADNGPLKKNTGLQSNDTLNLQGTATANSGTIKDLKVTGIITITGTGKLSDGLRFEGDVTGNLTQFEDATDGGVTVSGDGTLTLTTDKFNALKNTNFSLTSDSKRALTSTLVTKSRITIGYKTNPTKVNLKELSLVPVCIKITGTDGFEGNITDVTFTQNNPTELKEPRGQTINLANLAGSLTNATITKSGTQLKKETELEPDDTLTLTITNAAGSGTTLTGKITVKSDGKSLGGNLTLSGGIAASNVTLSASGGTLTGTVHITSLKYDLDEIHVNHQDTHCCYWGGKVFKWSDTNPMNEPWHYPVVLGPFQICLAVALVYSLHYRDSDISRSIVNQPKMSTALSIIFYMCSEILLAGSKVLPVPLLLLEYVSSPLIPPSRVS
ncbi:uncharacterized protein TA17570 [Theileria annulata]|uniref:Uncharacterized protein n=1 Tax=Theileria annulata TaxID=5874 RepID=Q4UBL6_THEAN|nr:uncharacterized protein TA17570 [Theileria annulata]CAI75785.1 hypothetical protein TA17570 [Theileria annulata]|eukprot:XP_955261.1 hypothetical protein TA17570 [Theileria annulata]